jgi:hypothetical protein
MTYFIAAALGFCLGSLVQSLLGAKVRAFTIAILQKLTSKVQG